MALYAKAAVSLVAPLRTYRHFGVAAEAFWRTEQIVVGQGHQAVALSAGDARIPIGRSYPSCSRYPIAASTIVSRALSGHGRTGAAQREKLQERLLLLVAMFGLHPLLPLLLMPLILLLVWPLARRSGKLDADLARQLVDDLDRGRARGYAIVAIVLGIVLLSTVTAP